MSKRKPRIYNPIHLVEAIEKWPNPIYDKKHGYYIYIEGRARSNQTRTEHIIEYGHDLKASDLKPVPEGINDYFAYKKDPVYKTHSITILKGEVTKKASLKYQLE